MNNQSFDIEDAIKRLEIKELNKMQTSMLSVFKDNDNLVLHSPTGSGKTLSFLLPLLMRISPESKQIEAVIITPSRELAIQIQDVCKKLQPLIRSICVYGGHQMKTELNDISLSPQIVIATPGRLDDHINRKTINLSNVIYLVLDEYDKSLEVGFKVEIDKIFQKLINLQKRILISATSSIEIPDFNDIKAFTLDYSKDLNESKLTYRSIQVEDRDKVWTLYNLVCSFKGEQSIVFCNHREAADRAFDYLNGKGVPSSVFHGGLDQDDRERNLMKFRNKSTNVLVCTDLAARGIDIEALPHVVHYQLPQKEDGFIHRNGRTARVDQSGNVYFIYLTTEHLPDFAPKTKRIDLEESPEIISPSLFETLYIGKGKKDKINKIDVVGFLSKKGDLEKGDIGLIIVKPRCVYVAISAKKIDSLLNRIRSEKIKGKSAKFEIAR